MTRAKDAPHPPRSAKAGRPPRQTVQSPQVRRRAKTARAAVRKDTMIMQTGDGPRVRWAAGKPKEKKR